MFFASCLALVVLILFNNASFAADENRVGADIEPGLGFKTAEFIAYGVSLQISEDDSVKAPFCRPEEVMYCLEKDGKFGCMKWADRVFFTFIPKNGRLELPLAATGYSTDKEQFPEKEYRIIPCGGED
ncbi:MAG: hypothetical protein ACD_15C00024G0002 [uncultured bacterium]|nr:MAG: hypothetical protein ACD_15C00024G0002 [uncultured bacterium]